MILRFLSYLDGTFQEEQAKQDIIFIVLYILRQFQFSFLIIVNFSYV